MSVYYHYHGHAFGHYLLRYFVARSLYDVAWRGGGLVLALLVIVLFLLFGRRQARS